MQASTSSLVFDAHRLHTIQLYCPRCEIAAPIVWQMAGFFGLKTAGKVHEEVRSPRKEDYAQLE